MWRHQQQKDKQRWKDRRYRRIHIQLQFDTKRHQRCADDQNQQGTIQPDKKLPFTLLVCTISIKIYQQISSIQTFQCSPARTCECRGQTETAEVREIGVSVETIREDLWEQKDEDRSSSGMIRRWAAGGRENLLKTPTCQRVRGNIPLPIDLSMRLQRACYATEQIWLNVSHWARDSRCTQGGTDPPATPPTAQWPECKHFFKPAITPEVWSYLQGCCGCSRAVLVRAGGRSDCSCAGGRCSICRLLSWVPAGGQTWSFTLIVLSRLHQMDHVTLSHSPCCLLVSCFARRASWRILRPPSEPSRHCSLYPAHWHKHKSS